MNIFLTGFMGCGKSTIGELLASRLQWRFYDLDAQIEAGLGNTVREVFATSGEKAFREQEKILLREIIQKNRTVISLGGGTLLDRENIVAVKKSGILIWLNAPLAVLRKRLGNEDVRPLLDGVDSLEYLYRNRIAGYENAQLEIDASGNNPGLIVNGIINKMKYEGIEF